jgi:hypothetical protein
MIATLILAGGKMSPELEPVAQGVNNRALIRVGPNDETMLDLVVGAVRGGVGDRGRILVAGEVPLPAGCASVAGGDSLMDTLLNGVKALREDETELLIATADIPFLTADAVRNFVAEAEAVQPTPFVYPIIPADLCYRVFPGMKRTTLRIAEGEFTGGNLALLDPIFVRQSEAAIRAAYARRKDVFALGGMLGAGMIFRLIASMVEAAIGRMLKSPAPRAVICPFAEVGTDVDRPDDVVMAQNMLKSKPKNVSTI